MADMRKELEKLESVDGFMAAGVFNREGELVAQQSQAKKAKPSEVCGVISGALAKCCKLVAVLGVGQAQFLNVIAPQANILAVCLPGETLFAADGDNGIVGHIMLILGPGGNTALGKIKLDSVAKGIALELR